MKNDEQKAIFNGAKVNDVLVFNPAVAFDINEAELSSLLKIKKEEVAGVNGNFSFQIEEITRMVPAELNHFLLTANTYRLCSTRPNVRRTASGTIKRYIQCIRQTQGRTKPASSASERTTFH